MWCWLVFTWWLMRLITFPCVYGPSANFLWRSVYSDSFPIFYIGSFFFLSYNCNRSLYILDTSPLSHKWFEELSPILGHGLSFHFILGVFWNTKFKNFDDVQFTSLSLLILFVSYLRKLIWNSSLIWKFCITQGHKHAYLQVSLF